MRKPLQGVWNIIRFNWHYFAISVVCMALLFFVRNKLSAPFGIAANIILWCIFLFNCISLLVSYLVYDVSPLYKLTWLNNLEPGKRMVNIHAGFDETSSLLQLKFTGTELSVLDFYDPSKHKEISIKRARKVYPPFIGTLSVNTSEIPFQSNSFDTVFAILSAHEIRKNEERICFFKELHRVLAANGQVVVTEHLRDTANFLAYNIGFFHFHSMATWLKTFTDAGFRITKQIKITPFITTFMLCKNGTAS